MRIRESKLLVEEKSKTRLLEVMGGMSTELVIEDGDDLEYLELVNDRYKTLISTCPGTPEELFLELFLWRNQSSVT